MSAKQIHELEPISTPSPEDLLVVSGGTDRVTSQSTVGNLQARSRYPDTVGRSVGDKLFERISVGDFGAVGDGINDDTASFQNALNSGAAEVLIPAGRYRLTDELLVAPQTRVIGEAPGRSVVIADHGGFAIRCEAAAELNVGLASLGFELGSSASGLRITGDRCSLQDLRFSGSSAALWAVDLVDANTVELASIQIGGLGVNAFRGNGIRWRNSDPANNPSNYGNGILKNLDIRLGSPDTIGVHLFGAASRLIASVLLEKVRVAAPMSGATPFPGSIGVKMESCVRITLQSVDLEAIAMGVQEYGISNALGASVGNQYIGVYAINVGDAYRDSNGSIYRSVQQRTFIGCDNFPATVGLNDGDTVLPAGLWLQSFVHGENAVRLRCFSGHELILDDGGDAGSLALDVGGSSPRIAPRETGNIVRLYLGRGSSPTNNTMRDVTVEPVLRLAPRDSENPATTTGQMVYAEGTNWDPGHGPGFYFFEGGRWRKVAYVD